MKRSEAIGGEHLRHNNKIRDINAFFDFIESRDLKPGKMFLLNSDVVYCAIIDYDNLQIQYKLTSGEIATELELFYIPQRHING